MCASPARDLSAPILEPFSPREKQIVNELLEARSVKEIAIQLHLSVNTVKDYLKTMYQKAQVHSARELLVKLYEAENERRGEDSVMSLIGTVEALLDGSSVRGVVETMTQAASSHCGAARAGFWLASRESAEWLLTSLTPGVGRVRVASNFIQNVITTGAQHLRLSDAAGAGEKRRLEALGVEEEVAAVRLRLQNRTGLLLITAPQHKHFEDRDIAALRVIGRLAEVSMQRMADAMVATA
jgi:DNA-binding CsgD family transcriptional regulator